MTDSPDPDRCATCGCHQPLEPLYDLPTARKLIPFRGNVHGLRQWLYRRRHLFHRRYQRVASHYVRLLSEGDCRRIRSMIVKVYPPQPPASTAPRNTLQ